MFRSVTVKPVKRNGEHFAIRTLIPQCRSQLPQLFPSQNQIRTFSLRTVNNVTERNGSDGVYK